MLKDASATATVAVKDLDAARRFYEGKLGLKEGQGEDGATVYEAGRTRLLVYASQYAGTNQATAVTWNVGKELDKTVDELKSKGVSFEHYDLPDTTRKGDIHVAGDLRLAWFKDPDGNIHALVNE